jgi:hypothetical protein
MNQDLLTQARRTAVLTGARIYMTIPSILAEGEAFSLRMSVVDADALPYESFTNTIVFENCSGVEGLPRSFAFQKGEWTGRIDGLTATGPATVIIRARVEATGKDGGDPVIHANPAWVFSTPPYRLYWGDIHVHTKFSNCGPWRSLAPEWCYQYAREITHLDFVAPADHLRGIASDPTRWPRLQQLARDYNTPGEFVSFLAFESSHAQGYGGDNNVYYLDDDAPHFWVDRDDMRGINPKVPLTDLWAQLDRNGKPYVSIPHHTGRGAKYRAWDEDYCSPEREPLFEIYSSWGSSEMRWNEFPMCNGNNDAPSYFVDALMRGARFGVIGSSDDHATLPGGQKHFRMEPLGPKSLNGYSHKGLAAVRAPRLTREALFEAMRNRATYATTDARSLVDMHVGDAAMGQSLEVSSGDPLRKKRSVRVRFTLEYAQSARLTLMRNGEPLETKVLRGGEVSSNLNEVEFEDHDDLAQVAIRDAKFHPGPFAVYYVRIEDSQKFHHWASPVWLDLV